MHRRSRQRIDKVEELISAERGRWRPVGRHEARLHAIAVAAIVLSGKAKVDEPLEQAWARALHYYKIKVNEPGKWEGQVTAARRLLPMIKGAEDESARFTEIFRTAPVWLLQFTGMAMDARLLKFEVPDVSKTLRWGSAGFEDARRWPLLPLGTMTAGNPIPELDPRQTWLILFCMLTEPGLDFERKLSRGDEEHCSDRDKDPLLEDILFSLDLDEKPEAEWSRYEKRRMRKLLDRISRLKR